MVIVSLDPAARKVLERYGPWLRECVPVAVGNRGGFSGACLWRVEGAGDPLCLRAWPAPGPMPERLGSIHRLMAQARQAGLAFVPAIIPTGRGPTAVEHAGRLWELTTWQPGRADFHESPTPARLEAACTALARVHAAWSESAPQTAPCPAVRRRLASVGEWQELMRSGWRPDARRDADDLRAWAERAWQAVQSRIDAVSRQLAPWADRPVPLQPCLCDIWHDHVLFERNTVTGLVDYGSVRRDHIAVDLARLLGSLVGDRAEQQAAGLDCYRRLRALSAEERALVAILDQTGTLLGAANWLRWLYRDGRTFDDLAAVARRLAQLVQRIEAWSS